MASPLSQAIEQQAHHELPETYGQCLHVGVLGDEIADQGLCQHEEVENADDRDVQEERIDSGERGGVITFHDAAELLRGGEVHAALTLADLGRCGLGEFVDHQSIHVLRGPRKGERSADPLRHGRHRVGIRRERPRQVREHQVHHRQQHIFAVPEIVADECRIDARLAGDRGDGDARGRQDLEQLPSRSEHAVAAHGIDPGRPWDASWFWSSSCVGSVAKDSRGAAPIDDQGNMMANWPFRQGVHDLGDGLYGYVQPDGTWGWSNAGLIVSGGSTLLIDTLMSVPLTRAMLAAFARQVKGGAAIDTVVNTHANPDHFFGNGLVADAQIIATQATAQEMAEFNPRMLAEPVGQLPADGRRRRISLRNMGRKFDFSGVDR